MSNNQNLSTNNKQSMPNPIPSQTKTKSKVRLVIGLVVGVLALAGIGGAVWYFAGMPGLPKEVSEPMSINLATAFQYADPNEAEKLADPYMKFVSIFNKNQFLMSSKEWINKVDAGDGSLKNPQSLISPVACDKIKKEISEFFLVNSLILPEAPTHDATITLNFSDVGLNQYSIQPVVKINKDVVPDAADFYNANTYFLKIPGKLTGSRWIYDPRYLLISNDKITPLASGSNLSVKARLCIGSDGTPLESKETKINIPQDGYETYNLMEINGNTTTYGDYGQFLTGVAQSRPLLEQELIKNKVNDITKDSIITGIKIETATLHHKDGDSQMEINLSLDGGNSYIIADKKDGQDDFIKPQGLPAGFNPDPHGYYTQSNTLTFTLPQGTELTDANDLRMIVKIKNTTKTGTETQNYDTEAWKTEANTQGNNFSSLGRATENGFITLNPPTVFIEQGGSAALKVDTEWLSQYNVVHRYGNKTLQEIKQDGDLLTGKKPFYTQVIFPRISVAGYSPFELFKNFLAPKAYAEDQSFKVGSAVVLPYVTPILNEAKFSFLSMQEVTPTSTPTPTQIVRLTPQPPIETPITSTVEGLGQECILWHRGHTRVVLKCRFFTTDEAGKEKEKLNIGDPRKIAFKYGETQDAINLGANVYSDPNGAVYPYAIIVRGLQGGGKYDFTDEAKGWKNGRHKYFYQFDLGKVDAKFSDKLVGADFETLNRLQAIGYYYTVVAPNRDYMKMPGAVDIWQYPNNKFADKTIFELENGGIKFWYDSNLTPTGIKFMLANDRKLKEYDTWLAAQLKDKGMLEAVKAMYPYHDRIYTNPKDENYWKEEFLSVKPAVDFGKIYDEDGVIYWAAMTTDKKDLPKSIKDFYPKKGKKDLTDIFGGKFGIAVSKEAKLELTEGLAGKDASATEQGAAQAEFAYQVVLKRGADEAGKAYAAKLKTYKKIAEYLADSKEYDSRIKDIEKDFGRNTAITEMYESIYGRPADVEGVGYWDNTKLAIDILKQKFLTSEEFKSQ